MASDPSDTTRRKHHRPSSTDDAEEHSKRHKHRHHHRHRRRHRSGKDKEETTTIAEGLESPKIDKIVVEPGKLVNNGDGGGVSLDEVLVSGGVDYDMEEGEIAEDEGLVGSVNADGEQSKKNLNSDIELGEIETNGYDDSNMVVNKENVERVDKRKLANDSVDRKECQEIDQDILSNSVGLMSMGRSGSIGHDPGSSSHGSTGRDCSTVRLLDFDEQQDDIVGLGSTPSPTAGGGDAAVGDAADASDGSMSLAGDSRRFQIEFRGPVMHARWCNLAVAFRSIFERDFHPAGWNWKYVPKETKEDYWEKFKEKFYWNPQIYSEEQVKRKWKSQFGDAYGKKQNEYRQFVTQRGKLHPGCDDLSIWRAWSTAWERPENVAKSQNSSRIRRSEPEGPETGMSRHTGGSRYSIDHADDLSQSLKRPPNLYEVFVKTHQKPGGTFVDKRSQNMNDEYVRRLEVAAAASSSNDVDLDQVWKEVVGSKKNRTYGVGRLGKLESQGSSNRSSSSQSEEVLRLREELDRVQQRQAALEADIDNRVQQQVQAALSAFMANFTPRPPPTS